MYILGLTGSIGMGKSATAEMFRKYGVPVHDADATVHKLMGPSGRATLRINEVFPDCLTEQGAIDRQKLGACVLGNDGELKKLEAILHPMVREEERKFLRVCQLQRKRVVVLDIPLLFETNGEKRMDGVAVVSATKAIQRRRVLARAGMSPEKFNAILKKQMPDVLKRRKADYIIFSGAGFRYARNQVKQILQEIQG
ncbi:Dephospho-CoA kinase [Candidatus Terasakiella magnetica]|uniref:Dephospho-CoA kinase n=1 Tax=Candidatus Terasakiella magnetica TaxID=1867952 RepID=A0A1C3RGD0_9PROT|nr:dephospho-CoA kinase [Candidatus Terasakiella magnetica]SCA56340.1 Dephospho-CoA kinase [Candidatus Terasakiella magnetica]